MTTSERFFLRVLKDSGNRFKVAEIMANRIRIGVVGAGTMPQRAHIPNLLAESQRSTIVALADARVETARLVAERYGIPSVYPLSLIHI